MSLKHTLRLQIEPNRLMTSSTFSKLLSLAICVTLSSQCLGQLPQPTKTMNELMAFAHLSYYSNRGFMKVYFAFEEAARSKEKDQLAKFGKIPEDVHQYLQQREINLLTSQADVSWLSQDNITESKGDDLPATLTRLSQFGLVELFRHQNSKLLDKPLVTRTELMHRLEEIAEQVTAIHATLFSRRGISNDELIVFYGIMRRRSVEFDLAILGALTEEERSRVEKLVSLAIPVAIDKIKQDSEKLGPFGFDNDR